MPASRSRPPLTPGPDGIVRLAGGNPQIAKGDGDAVVQSYIAAMPGWQRDIGRQLDALIGDVVPGVVKAVRWNTPFYGVEKDFWFASFHCLTRYVKLAFPRGAELDPLPPKDRASLWCDTSISTRANPSTNLNCGTGSPRPAACPAKSSRETVSMAFSKNSAADLATGATPTQLIDQRIADLPDWRGERLAQLRKLIHEALPDVVRNGNGASRSGRTAASSAPARSTRPASRRPSPRARPSPIRTASSIPASRAMSAGPSTSSRPFQSTARPSRP